ncbi:hypothetical protein KPL70_009729 [Citrus sinensis]|uniref:Uncharacterized protein n=2 Tax=Citrus TaxID=2706 RepID=A0ACB8MLX1_CITSI|nr:uncharacterized protein LOC18049112 isoform X2 [Citrus x clementina]XP_006480048.1 uncharacterized protein LOC102627165 isoform X2 [Citrus sinensis]ESR57696.1 hypothetical protein CICLE_v10021788mg [Citrus x clementina]KAH9730682.1 hypothetical protein KPL70_009729 [Citrus sinensis]KAH9786669.1 hypothetical protein KPL71_010342 [Citrus sinensis]
MGTESNSISSTVSVSTPTTSPSAKRSRDPEDEVYVDNLHSHKRYLSEIMASSLNGLTVGDPLPENLMESPARDEMSMQYSPMSEDSDDSRFGEPPGNSCSSQSDSLPTSPVSPHSVTSSQPRQRGSDSEGRFPSSPSDICHSGDLRRAALLRSVQMRAQPPSLSSFELSFGSAQEPVSNIEVEERTCSYMKSLSDEREYQIEECSSLRMSEPGYSEDKSCRVLSMKRDESQD